MCYAAWCRVAGRRPQSIPGQQMPPGRPVRHSHASQMVDAVGSQPCLSSVAAKSAFSRWLTTGVYRPTRSGTAASAAAPLGPASPLLAAWSSAGPSVVPPALPLGGAKSQCRGGGCSSPPACCSSSTFSATTLGRSTSNQ